MKRAVLYSFQVRGVKRRGRIIRQRGMGFDAVKLKGSYKFLAAELTTRARSCGSCFGFGDVFEFRVSGVCIHLMCEVTFWTSLQ